KPIHLLGIGDIPSIELAVPLGIDTFDSSHPTKCARHGLLFTAQGTVKIGKVSYAQALGPIEPGCPCYTCTNYSVAYVHHLFKAHELTYYTLASIHNLSFMKRLMEGYRAAILAGLI
ncbi:MAG: queuine tRNA-ribosyltransferase, partial [Candidatus Dependentiae bacterium]|nr:queuine tRNA-ribosyltransferase [Candidatus Dependentiae bacterium]